LDTFGAFFTPPHELFPTWPPDDSAEQILMKNDDILGRINP
jgi:hypothetical protein